MKYGSLFSGFGGLDLAVEEVFGAECAWHSEIDPNASKALAHHWPTVPNLGDITAIDWSQVEPVDVICGGFPCQDISSAGRQVGIIEGSRSGLWYRYADAVRVLRPRLVVVENVGALLVRGLDVVLGSLAELGYDATWRSVRASDVGACHRRERVFLVATPADAGSFGLHRGQGVGRDGRHAPIGGEASGHVSDGDPARSLVDLLPTPTAANPNDGEDLDNWEARRQREIAKGRNGNGFGTPLAIAVQLLPTPTVSDTNGPGAHGDGGDDLRTAVAMLLPTPRARDHKGPGYGDDLPTQVLPSTWGRYAAAIARWERITGTTAPHPTDDKGRLSAPFVEWMMGCPAGWVTDVLDRRPALKALGNGVVTRQAVAAIVDLLERMAVAA